MNQKAISVAQSYFLYFIICFIKLHVGHPVVYLEALDFVVVVQGLAFQVSDAGPEVDIQDETYRRSEGKRFFVMFQRPLII